jgi:uncharacterized protein YjbI with pentapeptide repeats
MRWWFRRPTVQVKSKGHVDVAAMHRLVFDHQQVQGFKCSDRQLDDFLAISSSFKQCSFERLSIRSASFGGGRNESVYEACNFDGSKIECGAAGVARFVGCSFRDTYVFNFFGLSVSMIDCVFSGTLQKVAFYGTNPENRKRNEFRGNDFSEALLNDVAFREGIDLTLQRFPVDWVKPDDPYDLIRTNGER